MSRRHKRTSFLIINYEMEKGPEEAHKLGFGYDDLEGTVEHPDWNRYQAAGRARTKELKVTFEVIFTEVKLKAQGDYNFRHRKCGRLTILELGRGRQKDKEELEPKKNNLKVRRA